MTMVITGSATVYCQSLYDATGRASYYAKKFDGRTTANGEKFSSRNFTAAHLTLPFGTMVRVTNLQNNKSIVVRINDRGPYIKGRIIDLARIAADSLDFINSGWTVVRVQQLPQIKADTATATSYQKRLQDTLLFQFPYAWLGNWMGDLKIYYPASMQQSVPVDLHILPTAVPARFVWAITFDSVVKNYELVIQDSAMLVFSLNNNNETEVMSSLIGNHFINRMYANGKIIESEYTLISKDEMMFVMRVEKGHPEFPENNPGIKPDSVISVGKPEIEALYEGKLERVK